MSESNNSFPKNWWFECPICHEIFERKIYIKPQNSEDRLCDDCVRLENKIDRYFEIKEWRKN